jgi:hypothetical protein
MIKEDQLLPMTKKDQGLKWLPWIGESYFTLAPEKRLLIVGEKYLRPQSAQLIDYSINSHCVKWMIEDVAAGRAGYGKEFEAIRAAVTGRAHGEAARFWNQVGFYEFIQRSFESYDETPSAEEFEAGWKVFFELTEILKPGICLFAGSRAAAFLKSAIVAAGAQLLSLQSGDAVDGVTPVTARIRTAAGQEIRLLFVGDAARSFDAEAWHEFLAEREGVIRGFGERSPLNMH